MLKEDREFYAIDELMSAFKGAKSDFANFPLPTEKTILAAELLRRWLMETNSPSAGAVAVVELHCGTRVTFLTVASGGGLISDNVVRLWEGALAPMLQNSFQSIQCTAINSAAIFYSPAHKDTETFIKAAFPNFALPAMPLGANDLKAATDAVKALPAGEFGMNYETSQQVGNLNPTTEAVQKMLAVAVALRINAYNSADLPKVRESLDAFRKAQEAHFPYSGREEFIDNIEALALRGGNINQYAFRENPGKAISNIRKIQSKLDDAWRVADLNRFCAEPKAFTYIKTHGIRDFLAGQLAMWFDPSRPNRYNFPGSEDGPYSDYMLPCTSCQTRSAEMLSDIVKASQTTAEEPIGRVASPPRLRERSASFSA